MEINRMMTAIIQDQDFDNTQDALSAAGFKVTRLASTGGFLGIRNDTLLIGFSVGQGEQILNILRETCRRRVEYMATPLEGAPFQMPLTTPVTIGGAVIFIMDVERYEVLE
jgi:uncharacterized protein YaaQ